MIIENKAMTILESFSVMHPGCTCHSLLKCAIVERRCKVVKINQVTNITRKALWHRPAKPVLEATLKPVIIKSGSIINDRVRAKR